MSLSHCAFVLNAMNVFYGEVGGDNQFDKIAAVSTEPAAESPQLSPRLPLNEGYNILSPPSTLMAWPVMKRAASEQRFRKG